MNKEKAFNEVKEILTKKGIEYTVSEEGDSITVKAGKIVQWFYFTEKSISVASSVIIDKKRVETSSTYKWYEDIEEFCFIGGDLWIREMGLGYTTITLKKDN